MTAMKPPQAASPASAAMLVTQTRVAAGKEEEFRRWQESVNEAVCKFSGFLGREIVPPNPPAQVDWVILQRFTDADSARAWLQSEERLNLLREIQPILVGQDDVHLVSGDEGAQLPAAVAAVTAVISMRVKPDQEAAFIDWQRRIAAAEAEFEGFTGYRLDPPVPGIQDGWTTMLRFDSDAHLEAWLNSDRRKKLLEETPRFSEEFHTRKIRSGFDPWFTAGQPPGTRPPAVWKQCMTILLVLYPTVYLFGLWFGTPVLTKHFGLPFFFALFLGNIFSVWTTGYWSIPLAMKGLHWWLSPAKAAPRWIPVAGAAVVIALYVVMLAIFSKLA